MCLYRSMRPHDALVFEPERLRLCTLKDSELFGSARSYVFPSTLVDAEDARRTINLKWQFWIRMAPDDVSTVKRDFKANQVHKC